MATGSASRAEKLPPALPAKQHRSYSRSNSSVDSDCVMLSPVGLHHQTYANNDVFAEPTDCNAAECPIHQRYDPTRHQERFFSDGTPPPVPKKRLARTLSLPGPSASPFSPLSPLSPLQRLPQNFDNPLYMLAPIPDSCCHEETEEVKSATRSPVAPLSPSQLSFDTPDEHLPCFFSSFDDHKVVSQGIQHRHLLFLRSMAQSVEAGILLHGETTDKDVSSYQPWDFLLSEGSQPEQVGDAVYYSLHSPKYPERVLGLRVHVQKNEAPPVRTKQQLSHVNVQNVVAHFQSSNTLRKDPSVIQTHNLPSAFKSDCTAVKTPGGGGIECVAEPVNISVTSVQSLLQRGHCVSVERDLPHATLEDFVQDSTSDCCVYDRQVCVLMLQILLGSQHLYNTGATAAALRPREIYLLWPSGERDEGENKPQLQEMKKSFKTSGVKGEMQWEKTGRKGRIQMLWRMQGSPRVVLNPLSSATSAPHPLIAIKSQIRALIQYCLAPQEGSSSLDSSPSQSKSSYRRGLQHLSSHLQNGSSGPQIANMVAMLQVLLWGPRVPLFKHGGSTTHTAVHNWLTIKRALLVMKLAEKGLIQDRSALDWEDCIGLQYLAFTDAETVVSVSQQWLTLKIV